MPVLDALRGLAILVVLFHRFNLDLTPSSLPARLLAYGLDAGWMGVQLFFVLSGFLITGILLDSKTRAHYYRTFFGRRVLRIFPLYYAVLIGGFVIVPLVTGRQPAGHEHQLWLWTYLSNWTGPLGLGVAAFPHFWSLGVEEQFYFIWPFLVRRLAPRGLMAVCVGLILVAPISRAIAHGWIGPAAAYEFTICRIDALAMGAAAAWALRQPGIAAALARRQRVIYALTAAVLFAGAVVTRGYVRLTLVTQTAGYSILAWTFVVLLVGFVLAQASGGQLARRLAPAPLRALGKYSYGMYVFHTILHHEVGVPVLARLGWITPGAWQSLVYTAAMTVMTFLCAVASYQLVEKHFLRLKRHAWLRA